MHNECLWNSWIYKNILLNFTPMNSSDPDLFQLMQKLWEKYSKERKMSEPRFNMRKHFNSKEERGGGYVHKIPKYRNCLHNPIVTYANNFQYFSNFPFSFIFGKGGVGRKKDMRERERNLHLLSQICLYLFSILVCGLWHSKVLNQVEFCHVKISKTD